MPLLVTLARGVCEMSGEFAGGVDGTFVALTPLPTPGPGRRVRGGPGEEA
jgi:hypothetical protein